MPDLLAGGLHALIGAVLGLVLTLVYPGHQLLPTGLPPLPDLASDQVRVTDRLLQLNRLQREKDFRLIELLSEPRYNLSH